MTLPQLTACMQASGRRSNSLEESAEFAANITPAAIHAVAIDWHNLHFLTEELLDVWWHAKSPEEKGKLFREEMTCPLIPAKDLSAGQVASLRTALAGIPGILQVDAAGRPENEASLAYDCACSLIESNCRFFCVASTEWFDTSLVEDGYTDGVADSVEYLEARGLIERHADHANLISIRDESEATL